jgi:alpha-tubulin suppressor-like RCC1 family protein
MDASTITNVNFTVTGVAGTVTYSGTTATFTPSSNLNYSTPYTATITTGVRDTAGNYMASNYLWSFTTGVAPDTTPPTVSSTNPADSATGVAINTAITATFSENMDVSTITTATFTVSGVAGAVAYNGTTATFTPSGNLAYSTTYTATITTGVRDAAGNPMASNYSWSFTTGPAPDTTPPTVIDVDPSNGAANVTINANATVTFSEAMDAASITTATFILSDGISPVLGTVTYNTTTATFTPLSSLAFNTTYTALVTTGVKDAAGNPMASNYSWSFRTVKPPVSAGTFHTVSLRSNGTLWTWGDNSQGQLGNGDTTGTDSNVPIQIGAATDWVTIATGRDHTVAIKSNSTLWAWGDNSEGQLGLGDTADRFVPTQVGADNSWSYIAAGSYHTVVIKSNGTLWAWGDNSQGQLGLGDTADRPAPTQVGTDNNWSFAAAGYKHTIAIKSDGTLWAWGKNDDDGSGGGQLGLGDITGRLSPVQVGSDNNWSFAACGWYHTVAIKTDGTLWAWGDNSFGGLGLGDSTDRLVPTQVGAGTNWSFVAAWNYHTIGIKRDNTLWAWGNNSSGQLGLGDTIVRRVPTQVATDTDWAFAAEAGGGHSVAIKKNGTFWTWGSNTDGQLGDGTNVDKLVPTNISITY